MGKTIKGKMVTSYINLNISFKNFISISCKITTYHLQLTNVTISFMYEPNFCEDLILIGPIVINFGLESINLVI